MLSFTHFSHFACHSWIDFKILIWKRRLLLIVALIVLQMCCFQSDGCFNSCEENVDELCWLILGCWIFDLKIIGNVREGWQRSILLLSFTLEWYFQLWGVSFRIHSVLWLTWLIIFGLNDHHAMINVSKMLVSLSIL